MRSLILCVFIALIFCVLAASPVFAIGLGVYGNCSMGQSYWDFEESGTTNANHYYYGGGLLFDTAVAIDRLFHYRLGIGYDSIVHDSYYESGNLNLNRIVLSNTFGFGIIRSNAARLWLGPQFRFSYNWGEDKHGWTYYDIYFGRGFVNEKDSYFFRSYDLALVFGANIHLPGKISLGLEFGPRVFAGFAGGFDISRNITYSSFSLHENGADNLKRVIGYEAFINVCVLIRINDEYKYSIMRTE